MAEEKSSNNLLILIGIGIILGAAFVYSEMKKQQSIQAQAQAAYTQAFAQQTQYLNDLNSTVKRLEGQVQVVQTLQPLPVLQPLQPLKLLEPELMQSLKPLEPLMREESQSLKMDRVDYRHDTEFIKWYTDNIIKPSVQQAAKESVETAIKQFVTPETQTVETIRTKPAGKWVINRDSDGAISSIETIKALVRTAPKEEMPKINNSREHIY